MISVIDMTCLFRLLLGDSSERLEMRSLTRVAIVEERGFPVHFSELSVIAQLS